MDRKNKYKHKPETAESIRAKRRAEGAESRKEDRERLLNLKRARHDEEDKAFDITPEQVKTAAQNIMKKTGDASENLKILRKGFSQGSLLIDEFLSVDNAMPALVGLLTGSDTDLQLETAWVLTNMATGTEDHAVVIIKHAGPYLITYLGSGNAPLQDQCSWALGNIAGDGQKCRDLLKTQGVIQPLVGLLQSAMPSVVQSAAFALSNMAREGEKNAKDLVAGGVLPALSGHLVVTPDNFDVLAEVAWVLSYISASGFHTQEIVEGGMLDKVVETLITLTKDQPENFQILTPLLRCLGNVCSGPDDISMRVCQNEALLPTLGRLLHSEHRHIKKECLWVLSNLSASSIVSQQIVDHGLIPTLVQLLSATFDIKKEAAYTLCNVCSHSKEFSQELFRGGALQGMIPLLKVADLETVQLSLSFCEMILRNTDNGKKIFEESSGLSGLEALEYHNNTDLREKTNYILDTYFYQEDHEAEMGSNDR